jgi:hypothetical protein
VTRSAQEPTREVEGAVLSELTDNMAAAKFNPTAIAAITDLINNILNVADEAVAKSQLQPEFCGVVITRKAKGSPFFTVSLDFADTVSPEEVTTLTQRVQEDLDARRKPKEHRRKLRAVELHENDD